MPASCTTTSTSSLRSCRCRSTNCGRIRRIPPRHSTAGSRESGRTRLKFPRACRPCRIACILPSWNSSDWPPPCAGSAMNSPISIASTSPSRTNRCLIGCRRTSRSACSVWHRPQWSIPGSTAAPNHVTFTCGRRPGEFISRFAIKASASMLRRCSEAMDLDLSACASESDS